MIRIFFVTIWSLTFLSSHSQVPWLHDMKLAQAISLNDGKFILVDFWADWCQPCKQMDKELWATEEMQGIAENFVPLKVNIDYDRVLAMEYQVSAIPRVLIISAAEDVIWDELGFRSSKPYLDILRQLPTGISDLNSSLALILQDNIDSRSTYEVGLFYQQLGAETENRTLKASFLKLSSAYFKKGIKLNSDPMVAEKAKLRSVLNYAYNDKSKQARKKLQKLDVGYANHELQELTTFIEAYCCKLEGDTEKLSELKSNITKKEYLAQL